MIHFLPDLNIGYPIDNLGFKNIADAAEAFLYI
jgi:hypothetical protein